MKSKYKMTLTRQKQFLSSRPGTPLPFERSKAGAHLAPDFSSLNGKTNGSAAPASHVVANLEKQVNGD